MLVLLGILNYFVLNPFMDDFSKSFAKGTSLFAMLVPGSLGISQ
jgi:hypothetical protein